MKLLLDLILLAFAGLVFASIRIRKVPVSDFDSGGFLPVRAVAAFGVIFSHCPRFISHEGTKLFTHLGYVGILFVTLFFAFSGYGLARSYQKKGSGYLDGFFRKRMVSLLCPCITATVLFLLLYAGECLLAGESIGEDWIRRFVDFFQKGTTIVLYSWYVGTIAVLYCLFFLSRRLFPKKALGAYGILLLGMLVFAGLLLTIGFGEHWFNSMTAFLIGMLWADFSEHPRFRKCTSHWIPAELLLLTLFGLTWVLRFRTAGWVSLGFTALNCCFPPMILFIALQKCTLKNRLLNYLGSRSYEIYLVQGLALTLGSEGFLNVPDGPLRLLFVLMACIALGEGLYRVDRSLIAALSHASIPQKELTR